MKRNFKNATSLYATIADEDILKEAKQGDHISLGYIVKKYEYFVRLKARKYFLVGADREDVVQEGLVGLYKAIVDYDYGRETSFKVFAQLCISRQIMTAINTHNRQKHIPLNTYLSIDDNTYGDGTDFSLMNIISEGVKNDPEWIYITEEERLEFQEAMKNLLTELEFRVFTLYMEGRSYGEMSTLLKKEIKSIDNALQRVRYKARNYMSFKMKT